MTMGERFHAGHPGHYRVRSKATRATGELRLSMDGSWAFRNDTGGWSVGIGDPTADFDPL